VEGLGGAALAPWDRNDQTGHTSSLRVLLRKRYEGLGAVTGPRKNVAEEAATRLRSAILSGELPAGSDLPGERELSSSLKVSRLSVRSALARLSAEGLVLPVHGSGTRVLDWRASGGVDLLGHLAVLAEGGAVPLGVLADLLELRRAVAVEAIGLAAVRCSAPELAALREHVAAQRELISDPAKFMAADLSFARKLVEAGHNLALLLLANTIVRVLEQHPGMEMAFMLRPEGTLAVYEALLDLIEERDEAQARTKARRILAVLDRALLERLRGLMGAYDLGVAR
jgi:GntR family transcriptional repressor for pyruvate dehydrogenase complex